MSQIIYNQCNLTPVTVSTEDSLIGVGYGDRKFAAKMPGDALVIEIFGEFVRPDVGQPEIGAKFWIGDETTDTILSLLEFPSIGNGSFYLRWLMTLIQGGEAGKLAIGGRGETAFPGDGMTIRHAPNEVKTLNVLEDLSIAVRAENAPWTGATPTIIVRQLFMNRHIAE